MHRLNLIPKEALTKQRKRRLHLFCIFTSAILFILLTIVIVNTNSSLQFLEDEIIKANQEIAKIKSKIQSENEIKNMLKDLEKRQQVYDDVIKNKVSYSTILDDIANLIPSEISVVYIGIDESGRMKIDGYTANHINLSQLMEGLKTVDGISDVFLGFTRFVDSKEDAEHKYTFEIIVKLTKER